MTDREKEMLNMIEFLLEYVRQVAQKQVVYQDCVPLAKIRTFVKEAKNEKSV